MDQGFVSRRRQLCAIAATTTRTEASTHTHTLRVEDPGTFLMNFLKRRKKTSDLPHDLREKKAASKDAFYSFSVCGPSGEFFYGV
jgi:hypothetical protein